MSNITFLSFFVLILLGLVASFIGGYIGIGEAPLILVFLVLVLGIPQFSAQEIVLTMVLRSMSLLALLAFIYRSLFLT